MNIAPDGNVAPELGDLKPSDWSDGRASAQALRAAQARQVSGRRRFVDPATCERGYSDAEVEFMHAIQNYKRTSGRMFPTWSEVLEVLQGLGYEKPVERSVTVKSGSSRRVASA